MASVDDKKTAKPDLANAFGVDSTWNDDWYWKAIEKYKGSSFYDTLANNPYLVANNNPFQGTLLQNIGEAFGDFSAEFNYYQNLRSQANQYFANVVDQMRQQEYNSPSAEVARMRAAGINPDLNGGQNIDPGSAAENDQPLQPMEANNGQTGIAEVTSLAVGFLSNVISMYQGIQSIKAGNLGLVASEIDNHNSALDFAQKELLNTITVKDDELDKLKSDPSFASDLILNAAEKFDFSTYSNRTRKVIGKYFNELRRNPQNNGTPLALKTAIAELQSRFATAQKSASDIMAGQEWDEDLDKMVNKSAELFRWYQDEVRKLQLKYQHKRAQNDLNVENTPGIADARARSEIYASQAAGLGIQQLSSQVPQWEIDKLNNNFRHRFYKGMHGLGTIGSIGSLFLPGLLGGISNVAGTAINLGLSKSFGLNSFK